MAIKKVLKLDHDKQLSATCISMIVLLVMHETGSIFVVEANSARAAEGWSWRLLSFLMCFCIHELLFIFVFQVLSFFPFFKIILKHINISTLYIKLVSFVHKEQIPF